MNDQLIIKRSTTAELIRHTANVWQVRAIRLDGTGAEVLYEARNLEDAVDAARAIVRFADLNHQALTIVLE